MDGVVNLDSPQRIPQTPRWTQKSRSRKPVVPRVLLSNPIGTGVVVPTPIKCKPFLDDTILHMYPSTATIPRRVQLRTMEIADGTRSSEKNMYFSSAASQGTMPWATHTHLFDKHPTNGSKLTRKLRPVIQRQIFQIWQEFKSIHTHDKNTRLHEDK